MQTDYRYIDENRQHLHTLRGQPLVGASTAKSIIGSKDNLMQWYADMAAVAGLALPAQDIKAEYEAVVAIRDKKARAEAKQVLDKKYPDFKAARTAAIKSRDKSAKTGTARHSTLEEYVKTCLAENKGIPLAHSTDETADVSTFVDWSLENVATFYFAEANCYSESLWCGGIADLGMKLKNGKRLVGDHKNAKEAYNDMFLQTAIYDVLLNTSGILDRDGYVLGEWEPADGYVIFPFRSEPFTPEFKWNAGAWREAAKQTINLYRLLELEIAD